MRPKGLFLSGSVDFFLDAGLLTGQVAEVEDTCATHFTVLVHLDLVDERGLEREDSLDSDATGNLADRKGLGERIRTLHLDDDTITVTYRIKEGDKERLQKFRGVVIQISGMDPFTKTFTVRKIASGVGVERIFPFQSPFIDSIEVNKFGKVRRARIFYLRDLTGKKARIREKVYTAENKEA